MDFTVIVSGLALVVIGIVLAVGGYINGRKPISTLGVILIAVGFGLMASPALTWL